MQATLPDVLCNEKLVKNSRLRLTDFYDRSVTMRSVVTATRMTRGGDSYFNVRREVQSVSGRNPMVDLVNTLTDDLSRTFAPQNLSSNTYSFDRRQNLRGIPTFVVKFQTKPGQTASSRGGNLLRGGDPRHTMRGKAWIDVNTMQVLRLEIDENNPRVNPFNTVADYGIDINGKPFWLLTKIVKTEIGGEWIAEYSGCKRFEVTSEIRAVR